MIALGGRPRGPPVFGRQMRHSDRSPRKRRLLPQHAVLSGRARLRLALKGSITLPIRREMSDLSRLLGDVYGAPSEEEEATDSVAASAAGSTAQASSPAAEVAPPAPHPARDVDDPPEALVELSPEPAPGWADDRLLDEAFADWVPGPGPHAAGQEKGWSVDPDELTHASNDLDAISDLDEPTSARPTLDVDDAWLLPHDDKHDLDAPGLPVGAEDTAFGDAAGNEDVPQGPWTRAHDDLLPAGRRGRRLALRRR